MFQLWTRDLVKFNVVEKFWASHFEKDIFRHSQIIFTTEDKDTGWHVPPIKQPEKFFA